MSYLKKMLFIILIFGLFQDSSAFALSKIGKTTKSAPYSTVSIQIYKTAAAYQKQGKYELAEKTYNRVLVMQPNFVEAKENLALIYKDLANRCYAQSEYSKGIAYAKKALTYNSKNLDAYNILSLCYLELNDQPNLILTYQKIIALDPKDDLTMNALAAAYLKSNQLEKASEICNKILVLNPADEQAQKMLKYISFNHPDKSLKKSNNDSNTEHTVPIKLYKLVKAPEDVDQETTDKIKTILDLIWSDPNGQIMLKTLMEHKVPINIIAEDGNLNQTKTLDPYSVIPISSILNSSVKVNIPISHIDNFDNPNLYPYQRIYNLQVFIHELGHAFIEAKNPKNADSMEEEIGVSMIGYNIANKIVTGKYLTSSETETYSMQCLKTLLADKHKNLPMMSDFNKTIKEYGISFPYQDTYSNIPSMYKKLLSEDKIKPISDFGKYK